MKSKFLKPNRDTQELARNFNEDEAVWRRFQEKRLARLRMDIASSIPDELLDWLEWLEAERKCRTVWAVGSSSLEA